MLNIEEQWKKITREIKDSSASLIAVSKTYPVEDILKLYQLGQRDFGENYVQEWKEKEEILGTLAPDIRWHFIGQLQSNKVKYLVEKTFLIHSIDRLNLLEEVEKQAAKINRIVSVLIEVDLASESNKGGIQLKDLDKLLIAANHLSHVKISGLMIIPPASEEAEQSRAYFQKLKTLIAEINEKKIYRYILSDLSMGMSQDYLIAIQEGATYIRVGSKIFGERK